MELDKLFSCAGKVAIVSGGAGPLYGSAISEALCQAGATVVVASRSNQRFSQKVARAGTKNPMHHRRLDLTEEESIKDLFQNVKKDFGRVDIVVNSALSPMGKTLEGTPSEVWQRSMQGNILGLYLMCRYASEIMQKQKSGNIINISSIWGVVAPDLATYEETKSSPSPVDYGFIKGGMIMFTRTLASYLGRYNIRVNCIVPGGISDETDNAQYIAAYTRKVPLGRWAFPEDIKGAIVFLASNASAYVTGTCVTIDGGYCAL